MWDEISAITGIVSAVCAIVSIRSLAAPREVEVPEGQSCPIISTQSLFAFLLACSGWCLAVLSYLWIFKPYGSYIRRDEYVQIIGVVVALPACLILLAGIRYI